MGSVQAVKSWAPARWDILVAYAVRAFLQTSGRLVPPADVAHFITDILKKHPGAQVSTQLIGKDGKPLPPQAKVAAVKPRPQYGEPGPITIAQAHLHTPQIDSAERVSQSVRKSKARKRH